MLGLVTKSALMDDTPFGVREDGLPSTFVPGRNIIFLTVAAIVAKQRGIKVIVAGTCETDFSGYPDCRDDTIKALQVTLNLGMEARLAIDIILEGTHTCYVNDREHRHSWGYGCATCDACLLRCRGWERYEATQSASRVAS
jgi:7-cyano-7-deazaguanine synthase